MEALDLEKTNSLFNLIIQQPDIDKIYLYTKDPYEAKYQILIKERKSTELKHLNDYNALLNTQVIWMILIKVLKNTSQPRNSKYYFFNSYIVSNEKPNSILTEFFIKGRKVNISLFLLHIHILLFQKILD